MAGKGREQQPKSDMRAPPDRPRTTSMSVPGLMLCSGLTSKSTKSGGTETQDSRVSMKRPAAKCVAVSAALGSLRGRDMTLVLRNVNTLPMLGFNN